MRFRTIAKVQIDVDLPTERAISIEFYPVTGETEKYLIYKKVVKNELRWAKIPKGLLWRVQQSGKNKTLRMAYGAFEEETPREIRRSDKLTILIWGLLASMSDCIGVWKHTIQRLYGDKD